MRGRMTGEKVRGWRMREGVTHMAALLQDGLWSPFGKDDALVVGSLRQHAHHFPVSGKLQS